jgi:hypothetical protein
MKALFFTIVSFLIATPNAFARGAHCGSGSGPDNICRREFAHDLFKCVITARFKKPKLRGAYIKNCVTVAKSDRDACLNPGPSQCELDCQAGYNGNVQSCNETYDPSVCGGNAACESFYLQERTNCTAAATDSLNACTAACPQE